MDITIEQISIKVDFIFIMCFHPPFLTCDFGVLKEYSLTLELKWGEIIKLLGQIKLNTQNGY